MSTLVDSNVLIDVLSEDKRWFEWSAAALARAVERGPLCINPIIYAELAVQETASPASTRRSRPSSSSGWRCPSPRVFSRAGRLSLTDAGADSARRRCRISTSARTPWWKITRCSPAIPRATAPYPPKLKLLCPE